MSISILLGITPAEPTGLALGLVQPLGSGGNPAYIANVYGVPAAWRHIAIGQLILLPAWLIPQIQIPEGPVPVAPWDHALAYADACIAAVIAYYARVPEIYDTTDDRAAAAVIAPVTSLVIPH